MLFANDDWTHFSPRQDPEHPRILRPQQQYHLSIPTLPKPVYLQLRELAAMWRMTNWEILVYLIQLVHGLVTLANRGPQDQLPDDWVRGADQNGA